MTATTRELLKGPGSLKHRVDRALSKAYDVGGSALQGRVMRELQDDGVIKVEYKPWITGNMRVWMVCDGIRT